MATNLSDQVRKRIRIELVTHDLSQEALASRLHMSPMSLSRRLRGRCAITLDEVEQIAEALPVPVEALLTGAVR